MPTSWRFAYVLSPLLPLAAWFKSFVLDSVIEMQTFIVVIIRQFRIAYPEKAQEVLRVSAGVMAPVLAEQPEAGKQLRLLVSQID